MSTHLGENVRPKLGPKCQYFVWPPLFSRTALTLLGLEFTRASQVATGVLFHSSMMTSQRWWILETLRSSTFRLRMPHRLPFPQLLLQGSGRLGGVFGVIIMLEYFPAAQSPKGGDHTHAAPDHDTPTTMLGCRQDRLVFVLLIWFPPWTRLTPSEPN